MGVRSESGVGDAAAGWAGVVPPPWSPTKRGARAEKPPLSRGAIVEAALRIVDTEGVDAVSMRRIAQEFGTGAASLYAYVANKDELFDLIVDAVMAEIADALPDFAADSDWRENLKEVTRLGMAVFRRHRDVAKAFVGRIPFGPNGVRAVEAQLAILRAGGVPDAVAAHVGDLLGSYMTSSIIEEGLWSSRFPGASEQDVIRQLGEIRDYLRALPADRFPHLTSLASLMMGVEPDAHDRFDLGLEIIVRGIASYVGEPAERPAG
jgi:AcrR family transcriptional regulator